MASIHLLKYYDSESMIEGFGSSPTPGALTAIAVRILKFIKLNLIYCSISVPSHTVQLVHFHA